MADLNYYNPLTTTNNSEQNTLGLMQNAFNSAIGSANTAQDTMVSSYLSANASRRACYAECPQGWTDNTTAWAAKVKTDASQTSAGADDGLKDVIASCKAGCDLKWAGIVQNSMGTQGVDGGQTIGRYTDAFGKEHDLAQCSDLSKYAPKVKLGNKCDADEECESDVCSSLCGDGSVCALGATRVDGSDYAWGNTFQSLCKSDVENAGLTKWPNVTQYFKYGGVWVKVSDFGFPSAPDIENQRVESGDYISDVATAIRAADAYGDYCKGFHQKEGTDQFILQSAGGENPKPSWSVFLNKMSDLNNNVIEGFTSSKKENEILNQNPKKIYATSASSVIPGTGGTFSAESYNRPTFPIAATDAAMKKTCPKGWTKGSRGGGGPQAACEAATGGPCTDNLCADDNPPNACTGRGFVSTSSRSQGGDCGGGKVWPVDSNPVCGWPPNMVQPLVKREAANPLCYIDNDDMRRQNNMGWDGTSYGCNLPGQPNHYNTDCDDVPNKNFYCWHDSGVTVPDGQSACKAIKGSGIPDCYASGGRPRETKCPVPAKMILYIVRPSQNYFATKNDIVPVLQQIETEFPDVRLTDKSEMDDIIAKGIANCKWGWYRTNRFDDTTWKTYGFVGVKVNIPVAIGYPSIESVCEDGSDKMMTGGQSYTGGKGGIYITLSGTPEFTIQKLVGLGFKPRIIESHSQLMQPPPKPPKQIWALSNWTSSGQRAVYRGPKGSGTSIMNGGPNKGLGKPWEQMMKSNTYTGDYNTGIKNSIAQLSTGQKEVYGVKGDGQLTAHATHPDRHNAKGDSGWRSIVGPLKNINATNKDFIFGTTSDGRAFQCKKPCLNSSWKQISTGPLKSKTTDISWIWGGGGNNRHMSDCSQYLSSVGPWQGYSGSGEGTTSQGLVDQCTYGLEQGFGSGGGKPGSDGYGNTDNPNDPCTAKYGYTTWSYWGCKSGQDLKAASGGGGVNSGGLKQLAGGQNNLYGISTKDNIYRTRLPISNLQNPQWTKISGELKQINATNKDYVYGVNKDNVLFRCKKPCSGSWTEIGGANFDGVEADNEYIYGNLTKSWPGTFVEPVDKYKNSWWAYDWGGGKKNFSPEPFVGGVKEGYAPLENDMINQCLLAGTKGGATVDGVEPTGDFLVQNRKKEKAAFAKLQSMQRQVKNSINKMQSDNLHVDSLYKEKNTALLKKLASYGQVSHKLLKAGSNLDTLSAQQSDSLLSKNSIDMSYYLWLTLAISILGVAITKIK